MGYFLDLLNQAAEIVEQAYPGSKFLEADGSPSQGPASAEADVDTWRFVFRGPRQNNRPTTVVLTYESNAFGTPTLENHPFLGDYVIQLPITMELQHAIDLKNNAGYTGTFDSATLIWPLSPSNKDPLYVFHISNTHIVILVGTDTGDVSQQVLQNDTGTQPTVKTDDYNLNPQFLYQGGCVTVPTGAFAFDATDATAAAIQGFDTFNGLQGIFLAAPQIPTGRFHRFRVKADTDPKRAAFNFTSEATSLIGCITPPNYPERPFNQGAVGRVFVFAGSFRNTPACFNPPEFRPIRASQTTYGWYIEVDSGNTGNYDMVIYFYFG